MAHGQSPIPRGAQVNGYRIDGILAPPTQNSWVYDATSIASGGKFVFKYIRPTVARHLIESEIQVNQAMSACPNAVIGFDFCEVADSIGYFMDKFTRGDLLDYIINHQLAESVIASMAHRVLEALAYMHESGFAHRDIKPDNIFLTGDGDIPETYLGDFGLSMWRNAGAGEFFTEHVGSRPYGAPELFGGQLYDESIDIWAFGVTLYVMFARQMPFPDPVKEPDDFMYMVQNGDFNGDDLVALGASDLLVDLIGGCLRVNPMERFTAHQALDHPFFAQEGGLQEAAKQGVGYFDDAIGQTGQFDW
jgi:serine/threonine protein kinase